MEDVGGDRARGLPGARRRVPVADTRLVCIASPQAATSTAKTPASVAVSPAKVNVRAGSTRKFFAQVSGNPDAKVVWRVNGIKGGAAATGTIAADGTFTAPEIPPKNNVVEVEAVSAANSSSAGKAVVTLLNPVPVIDSLEPKALNYGEQTVAINGSGFLAGSQVKMNGVEVATKFRLQQAVDGHRDAGSAGAGTGGVHGVQSGPGE